MPTECSAKPMGFARVDSRAVVADFDGGEIASNAGGLLLGATDRVIGLVGRFAACFTDGRAAERVVHEVATLVGQRVFGPAPVLFRSFESNTRHQGDRIWQQYTAMSSSVMQFASRSPVA